MTASSVTALTNTESSAKNASTDAPITGSSQPDYHFTKRLLIETVAPNTHFIFNPISGALDLADDDDLALLNSLIHGEPIRLSPTKERELRDRLYLFSTARNEEEVLEDTVAHAWAQMRSSQPEAYTICPTLACNLACAYCFEGDSLLDKQQGVMTDTQVDQMFEAIGAIRGSYARENQDRTERYAPWIGLFGGEPFLPNTRRCITRILEKAASGGFLVSATTNGVNLTRYEDLLREYADILAVFQVTLDGPKAVHDSRRHRLGGQGTFDEIVAGIDLLLSLKVDVDLRVNVDAGNLPALPDLVDFVHEKGWDQQTGFQMALAPVTLHQEQGCQSRYDKALSEMEMSQQIMKMVAEYPLVGQVCRFGFLRHLEYLISILEPDKLGHARNGVMHRIGPRYWYCEASTDKNYVFTPEGLIYSCSESVGHPEHAIGRFDPELSLWKEETDQWIGRTILSHPKCRTCSISTLCGGGCNFAARTQQSSAMSNLLQINLNGYRGTVQTDHASPPKAKPDPFCSSSEESVRAYLQYAGQKMLAAS